VDAEEVETMDARGDKACCYDGARDEGAHYDGGRLGRAGGERDNWASEMEVALAHREAEQV
jgi:hypothetical protein